VPEKEKYKPITLGVVTAYFLPTFTYLVPQVGDLYGKHRNRPLPA
jgi:hypothetical protein